MLVISPSMLLDLVNVFAGVIVDDAFKELLAYEVVF
jgi:hypothetical protein